MNGRLLKVLPYAITMALTAGCASDSTLRESNNPEAAELEALTDLVDDSASTRGDPETGPTEYDASGTVRCSYRGPSFDQQCDFRVVRGNKAADIWLENIAGGDNNPYRVLYFVEDRFNTRDSAETVWERQGDNWVVRVASREYYIIPDALIYGG